MKTKNRITGLLTSWYDIKLTLFFEGILVGAIAGGIAVLFRFVIEKAGDITGHIYEYLSGGHILATLGWFIVLILVGISLGFLVKKIPMISGSGIPQVKGYLLRQFDLRWVKQLAGKFFGGVLSLGFGLSLGREGPSIQLGASVGKGISKILKRPNTEEKYLVLGGAGAGLAAAFNAPLAGVVFVLEELQKSLSPAVLTCVIGACAAADFVAQQILGRSPVFSFDQITALPLKYYPLLIILGIACGVLSKIFNLSIIKLQDIFSKIPKKLVFMKPVLPFILVGLFGMFYPSVIGGGHDVIIGIGGGHINLNWIIILVAAKLLFTAVCYGSGAPGGIFLPLLVIGALIGKGLGVVFSDYFRVDTMYQLNFLVLGMAAFFTGVVRAPVTGSILITEMTGSFHHLLALLTVSMVAYVMTDVLKSFAIYDRLLERMLNKKSTKQYKDSTGKIIMEIPVCMASYLENRYIRNVKWPMDCLVVGVRRGENEIIPNGDTQILQGDFIIVLANKNQGKNLKMRLVEMGQPR